MECRCPQTDEFTGADAENYLAQHLVRDADGAYACPDTGTRWRLDESDPEQPRLRRT